MTLRKQGTGPFTLLAAVLLLAACQQTTRPAALPGPGTEMLVARPAVTPGQLQGLEAEALGEILGPPTVVRHEADAEIWQYQANACVLDLFLYAEGESKSGRLIHLEARSREDASPLPAAGCLASLSDPAERMTARAN